MPVNINWYPFYRYPALSLWAVLIVVLLVTEARNSRAWLILLPAAAIHALWLFIKSICSFGPSEAQTLGQIFIPLYIGVAVLFTLAHKLARPNRPASFLLAAAVLALAGLASFFAYNFGGTDISEQVRMTLTFYAVLVAAFLLALTITAFVCRDRYTRLRFAAWMLCASLLLTVIFTFVCALYDFQPSDLDDVFEVMQVGVGFGLGLCGIVLPFMILAFTSSFYRQRSYSCLRLAPVSPEQSECETEPPG
jgi:hypothetical protein